jgi:hypothetical protein
MTMTIAGVKISEARFIAMSRLLEQGEVAASSLNTRTARHLVSLGFAESFVPEATAYAMAARGRVRYYRLTKAGTEAILGVKKLYNR